MRFFEELWIYKDQSVWMFTTSILGGERGRIKQLTNDVNEKIIQATRSDLVSMGFIPMGRPHESVA